MTRLDFEAAGGTYIARWGEPEYATVQFDMLRSERFGDLTGEVSIWATPDGLEQHVHTARMNLTSTRSRAEVAKHCTARSNGHNPDWTGILEVACVRTIEAYRAGEPAIFLRDAVQPDGAGDLLPPLLLGRLPTIVFGDGGSAKSYLALAAALSIHAGTPLLGLEPAVRTRIAYLDWEMDAWEHRQRMLALVGEPLPDLVYVPCRRPFVEELDRLRRVIRQRDIGYVVVDSVALACDGPPEAAEVANRFFAALRQLERGSLLIAHTTKADEDHRPFGSVFWNNAARRTWYVKRQQEAGDATLTVGLFNRKANTGPLHPPLGFTIDFADERTTIRRTDVRDVIEFAGNLPVKYRMTRTLAAGALPLHEIAEELRETVEAVRQAAKRGEGRVFTRVLGPDGVERWGLLSHAV